MYKVKIVNAKLPISQLEEKIPKELEEPCHIIPPHKPIRSISKPPQKFISSLEKRQNLDKISPKECLSNTARSNEIKQKVANSPNQNSRFSQGFSHATSRPDINPRSSMSPPFHIDDVTISKGNIKFTKTTSCGQSPFAFSVANYTTNNSHPILSSLVITLPKSSKPTNPSRLLVKSIIPDLNINSKKSYKNAVDFLKKDVIIIHVMQFMNYEDFTNFMIISKKIYNQKYIRKKIELILSGSLIMPSVRKKFWLHFCDSPKITQNPLTSKIIYEKYANSFFSTIPPELEKDLERSFTSDQRFNKNIKNIQKMRNILKAFIAKNPKIGYVQGLSFICGNLLLILDDETVFFSSRNFILK